MKNTSRLVALAIAASIASPALASDASQIKAVHNAIRRTLKDPQSARFSDDFVRPGAVCGLISVKNSYGGYTGDKRYVYVFATGQWAIVSSAGDTSDKAKKAWALAYRYC